MTSPSLHTNRPPEMWTPYYSVKRTLGSVLTVSPPLQTHPFYRRFGTNFVDSIVKQELEVRYSAKSVLESLISLLARVSNCHVPHLRGHRSYYIINFSDRPHPCHIINPSKEDTSLIRPLFLVSRVSRLEGFHYIILCMMIITYIMK